MQNITTTDQDLLAPLSAYSYRPSAAWAISFIAIFSIIGLAHVGIAVRKKYWIVFPTLVLGILGEIIGWAGRYWSHRNVLLDTPFMMQIASLIIAPVFFSAYNYTMFGNAVKAINPTYCAISDRWFVRIFITADIISLILQAVGGGWAASVNPTPDAASNLMLAGIAFQLIVMVLFLGLGIDFCLRAMRGKSYAYKLRKEERDLGLGGRGDSNTALALSPTGAGAAAGAGAFEMGGVPAGSRGQDVLEKGQAQAGPANGYSSNTGAMDRGWWLVMLGWLSVVWRLSFGGWDGELIHQEMPQNILDGVMMVIASGIFLILHPGWLLRRRSTWRGVIETGR